jgi:threonine dehydratase
MYFPSVQAIKAAYHNIQCILKTTPLQFNNELSKRHSATIFLKREDLTPVRSYKIRGAYNKLISIKTQTIVSCSAGNHAQGVALSCQHLSIKGNIFMPTNTPLQKINKVKQFGGDLINIHLEGSTFDQSFYAAKQFSEKAGGEFIHPFDDEKVIEGQGTVGLELLSQSKNPIDYIFLPVGGGGLAAGVSSYIKAISPSTKIIGVEPLGAPSMTEAFKKNKVVILDSITTFVDGASVKKVGDLNFPICKKYLDKLLLIDEGHVCSKILQMYNEHGFIIEPAGVLSLCALDTMGPDIKNTNVVCILSGGNSDVFRMPDILERSLVYEGLKHYFRIEFPQRPGALKEFIMQVMGKDDDIIYFRYTRLINRETGPVIIGIQLKQKGDLARLIQNMNDAGIIYERSNSIE